VESARLKLTTPVKAFRMSATRIHILLSFLVACSLPAVSVALPDATAGAQESPAGQAGSPDAAVDMQLGINKTALLENKSDKNRVDAATLLLFSKNPAAREFLLDVLGRADNPPARAAVCDALNPVRVGQEQPENKGDFLKPLLAILTSEKDPAIAKRAAEALLIFGYEQVQPELEKAVDDPSLPISVRMNIIYALRRQPDKAAVTKLIDLLSNSDPAMVEAARAALASAGLSVGPDSSSQPALNAYLDQRGVETYLRDRLIRQETRVRELETDLSDWQKRYLAALGGWYDSLADDTAKNAFLRQRLASTDVSVRSWALDKLQELRNAKGTLNLKELESSLTTLVADPVRQIRLKTARVLALMGELNTSKALLEQLKVEPDEQIMREILVALGETCYAGSLPTAGHKVPDEVRKETLDWAVRFLDATDADKARSGAAVIGKLLEQDGLKPQDVARYLKALSDRYVQVVVGTDPALRSYLLGTMAGLCSTRSTCRDQAIKLYSGHFDQALADKAEIVRQSAVDGRVSIDKAGALRQLSENMAADPSVAIRQKLIDLAGEVGGPQDLDWLAEKVGVAGDGEPVWAWQAMLKIFRRSDPSVLSVWTAKIKTLAEAGKLATDQRIAFLTLVEQQAQNENRADLLKAVRWNLAQLYVQTNNLKQASDSLKALIGTAATPEERQQIQALLLRVYLGLSDVPQASDLISKCFSDKELDSKGNVVVRSIEEYLNDPKTKDPAAVIATLRQIKIQDAAVGKEWERLLSGWTEKFAKAKKAEDGGRADN
jgi:HEAT repeat protein